MTEPLYRRLLGARYDELPSPLQAMHDVQEVVSAQGLAKVERGRGMFVALIAWVFGIPVSGENVPLIVTFTAENDLERWQRNFDGRLFCSTQERGAGRREGLLVERFGPLSFCMRVVIRERRLHLEIVGAAALGVSLPGFFLPKIDVFEHDADDRFNFHVDLRLPLLGRLVRYTGWLVPAVSDGSKAENKTL